MSLTLSHAEIFNLTEKKQHAAQLRELTRLGIPAKQRANGSVYVLRAHLDDSYGRKPVKKAEPDFGALANVSAQA